VLRTENKTKRCKQEESEFRRVQSEKQSDESVLKTAETAGRQDLN
jgi:hypothetical protein